MKKIDCCGDYCPVPLLKVKKELENLNKNESFMMVTDHSCVVESLEDYFKDSNYQLTFDEVINGVWEIVITKA